MSLNKWLTACIAISFFAACSSSDKDSETKFHSKSGASIMTKEVKYRSNQQLMNGFLAMPEGEGPFPGILVVHEWWGQTEYPRERARQLAAQGYAAFAVDMYGGGKTADHPSDAKGFAAKVMGDMDQAQINFKLALETLKQQEGVDGDRMGAMGYCFGGAVVLEMARRGTDLDVVASYHGDLTPLVKGEVKKNRTRIMIFNGGSDPMVPKKAVNTVRKKLKKAGVRYKFVNYKKAKHGFTNPEATANGEKFELPLAYDETADKDSWEKTMAAFKKVFKR